VRKAFVIAATSFVAMCVLLFGGAYLYVAYTPEQDETLPEHTISMHSERGSDLLHESDYSTDYGPLDEHLRAQVYRSYCGVATGTAVAGAFGAEARQATFFEETTSPPISSWNAFFSGLTLRELADLLEARDYEVKVRYAGETSAEAFRREARANLDSTGDFVVVNYLRSAAGQEGGGHISPLGAYHAGSDRLLVLDTARYKYPPFWITADRLFEAMATEDDASGQTRGYLLVDEG
jgi:hypothetical protein